MNILFLTLVYPLAEDARGIYVDLMQELREKGNNVYVATPVERRNGKSTNLTVVNGVSVLQIKTGNIQKVNLIEKGISTILIESHFKNAIKKEFDKIKFDVVMYSTPPITFAGVINYVKKRDNAESYLLLKDIFPQNAVDMGMIKENSVLHKYFSKKEKSLYEISDYIGCMSPMNKKFLLKHNEFLNEKKIEICPNSIKPLEFKKTSKADKDIIREKYDIPQNVKVIVYGGNLGKPQGINFLIDILNDNKNKDDRFFLIVGSGTEYKNLETSINKNNYKNVKLLSYLEKEKYDELVKSCDIGLILLDNRFTIPNFPSRILSYMEVGMPILAATDKNTDVGTIIESGEFGYWNESGDINGFRKNIDNIISYEDRLSEMGKNSREYLEQNYTVEKGAEIILKNFR